MENEKLFEFIGKMYADLKMGQNELINKVKAITEDIALIKIQQKEHVEILGSLKTASEFHKADVDNLTHQIAGVYGDLNAVKSAVAKGEKAYDFLQNFNKFSSEQQ